MNKILFGLTLIACAAGANAAPHCVSFSPAGYCDSMQYDSGKKATWVKYDCASNAKQTSASWKAKTTHCDGLTGCDPAYTYGWDSLDWQFNKKASTGTLTGVYGGTQYVLQQDMPVTITAGLCAAEKTQGGVSSLAR